MSETRLDENDLPDEEIVAMFERGQPVEVVDTREQLFAPEWELEESRWLHDTGATSVRGKAVHHSSMRVLQWRQRSSETGSAAVGVASHS